MTNITLPLNSIQERYWALYQAHPEYALNHMTAALEIREKIDSNALSSAFRLLAARHELLRSGVVVQEGMPVFRVEEDVACRIETGDFSDLPEDVWQERVRECALTQDRKHFDLRAGPLLRAKLLRRRRDRAVVIITVHHLVADGWSLGVIVRELAELYVATLRGYSVSLPTPRLGQADAVRREQALVESEEGASRLAWWRSYLGSYTRASGGRKSGPGGAVKRSTIHLDRTLVECLLAFSRTHRGRLSVIMLAAFMRALARVTGESDIVVKQVLLNRSLMGDQYLVGDLMDLMPIRLEVVPGEDLDRLVARVRDASRETRRRRLPFWELVRAIWPEQYLDPLGPVENEFNMHVIAPGDYLIDSDVQIMDAPELSPLSPWSQFEWCLVVRPQEKRDWLVELLVNSASVSEVDAEECMGAFGASLSEARSFARQ